jgi:hypothetical protein
MNIEHPPAMHSALVWCIHGHINNMIELNLRHYQGIAGRSNVQHRTLNGKR